MGITFNKAIGHWEFWYVNPSTGKRTKKRILHADKTPAKDAKEAERLIAPFRREIEGLATITTRERVILELAEARQLIASKTHTLGDLADIFAKSGKYPSNPARQKYAGLVIDRFVEWCKGQGIEAITDVDEATAQKYIDTGLADLAANTVKKHKTILQSAFAAVCKELGIIYNPFADVSIPVPTTISRKDFSVEQVEAICGCFETWFTRDNKTYVPDHNDELYVCFILGLYAGCRLKDACLMQWSSIDLAAKTITYTPSKTKGSSGKQVVLPIIDGRELDWLKQAQGWDDGSGYVCPHVARLYMHNGSVVSRIYISLFADAAGVVNRAEGKDGRARSLYGFHSLRHTCASILANAGVDLSTIAGLVGHSSTAITQVYAHISAQHQADEMRRAFGKGAQTKTEIIKILDTMDEKRLKQVLTWLKSI